MASSGGGDLSPPVPPFAVATVLPIAALTALAHCAAALFDGATYRRSKFQVVLMCAVLLVSVAIRAATAYRDVPARRRG